MKIILSRKGFDSGAGGFPNPILPSGQLCMFPIPDRLSAVQYRDIRINEDALPGRAGQNMGSLVSQLTGRKISPMRRAHLDPDLQAAHLPRPLGWRPAFGQHGAALGHLHKQGIGVGDLFLFFGWFRETKLIGPRSRAKLAYVKDAPDLHVLFGWLQVGKVVDLPCGNSGPIENHELGWASSHPHMQPEFCWQASKPGNRLYVSRDSLDLNGLDLNLPGGGTFPKFVSKLQLSQGSELRSIWLLPDWFMPLNERKPLTYHGDLSRWTSCPNGVLLRTVGRGQEFVLDGSHYPESNAWLRSLFDF